MPFRAFLTVDERRRTLVDYIVQIAAVLPTMLTHVEFRSSRFPAYEDEENAINPGRYGKRLAEFLARGLREKGFEAAEPVAEDWGWVVHIKNESFSMWIGCGNKEDDPADGFLCFIEPHTPTIRKLFRKIDVSPHVGALREAIDQLLSAEADVRDKRWWTHEEINQPNRADS
jgi:hypothetical protein